MLNPLESATWYPTWEDFLPGDEQGNNNLIKLSLNDCDTINNSVGGLPENWWFNRYYGWGPVFRIDGPTSGAYYQNQPFLAADPLFQNNTVFSDKWQLLYFKPGDQSLYSLGDQPLSNWPGGTNSYFRGIGTSYEEIIPVVKAQLHTGTTYNCQMCPMQFSPTIGLIADAFGGWHNSYKGIIVYPIVSNTTVSKRSDTYRKSYKYDATNDTLLKSKFILSGSDIDDMETNYSILSRMYSTIKKAVNNTTTGGSSPWFFETEPVTRTKTTYTSATRFNSTYSGVTYTAECNSIWSTTTKYLYSPFKINTNYNWFYGSLLVQMVDILGTHMLASGGSWDAGNGRNGLYVLGHPNFDTNSYSFDPDAPWGGQCSPLRGYMYDINGLCTSAMQSNNVYRIPPNSIWLSSKRYYAGEPINDLNINRYIYDIDNSGKINKLINSVFNGATSPIYEFFTILSDTEQESLSNILGIDQSYFNRLKTSVGTIIGNSITVVTVCAYVTMTQLNTILSIRSNYDFWWFNYQSSTNYMKITNWPLSDTGGMMIDLFYIIFFDDYSNTPFVDATLRSMNINLNTYESNYMGSNIPSRAYWHDDLGSTNAEDQIYQDFGCIKLFTQALDEPQPWEFPYYCAEKMETASPS